MSEPNQVSQEQRDDQRPTLLLVDGYGLIFRAYYAIKNEISTSKGEVVNAVFGFASMLLDVLRRESPDYAIIAMEGGPTFRDEEFAEYKANRGAMPDDLRPQSQVAEQPAFLGHAELGSVGELPRLSDVVEQCGGHQQVGVQPGVKLADLTDKGADGDGVLDQPADVGVVARSRAGCAPELGGDRVGEQHPLDDAPQRRVVHLPGEVLEEALELLRVSIRGGQELRGVELRLRNRSDVLDLGHELPPEALDLARHPDRVAALESCREPIDVAERARRDRSAPVAKLEREVDRSVPGGQPVLADAGVGAAEAPTGGELGDGGIRWRLGGDLSQLSGGFHALMFAAGADAAEDRGTLRRPRR